MKLQHILRAIFIPILISLSYLSGCSDSSLNFFIQFPELSGLKQGDHVYFERNVIGQVTGVTYTKQGDYLVEVTIASEFRNATTEDSQFYIEHSPDNTSALAVIVEQQSPGGTVLTQGITVPGSTRSSYLDSILGELKKKAGEAESELNRALNDLQKSLDATSEELDRKLKSAIDDLSLKLDSFTSEIQRIPDSDEIQQIEESFSRFADEFNKAQQNVQDHIRNELLPRFRQELEQLRKQLKKEGREHELENIDRQAQELEMI